MIYIYYGGNSFLIQEKLSKIKEVYEAKYSSGINFFKFDLEEDISDLKLALANQSMFGEKKLILARGVLNAPEVKFDEIKNIVTGDKSLSKSEEIILVMYDFVIPRSDLLGRSDLKFADRLKFLKTLAEVKEFKNFSKPQLIDWCLKKTNENNIVISRGDLAFLIDGVGCDIHRVWNEILKLALYGNSRIERKYIDQMATFDVVASSFKVTDALAQKRVGSALSELEKLWQNNGEPVLILGAIVWQFRNMLKLADNKITQAEAVQKFKLNPWVAQKNLAAVKNFSPGELKNIYQNLADTDVAIKTGQKDGREALEDFVYSFLPRSNLS